MHKTDSTNFCCHPKLIRWCQNGQYAFCHYYIAAVFLSLTLYGHFKARAIVEIISIIKSSQFKGDVDN